MLRARPEEAVMNFRGSGQDAHLALSDCEERAAVSRDHTTTLTSPIAKSTLPCPGTTRHAFVDVRPLVDMDAHFDVVDTDAHFDTRSLVDTHPLIDTHAHPSIHPRVELHARPSIHPRV